ncbi:FYN-binding protein 1 isoform X2 [Girardinichthys multiradiatus]|nr:FYN-binding protein 1 isoform X2 [Girardinichthys multiradiatus]
MARFQASGASIDDSTPVGRPKTPLQPLLSSGPAIQKKPILESLSGSAINSPQKQSFLKSTPSTKSDTDAHEPNKTKALASKFGNSLDEPTISKPPVLNKVQTPLKSPFSQATEAKGPIHKPPFNKPPLNSTMPETKPVFPKTSGGGVHAKPSWVKEDSGGGTAPNTSTTPKTSNLHQKPASNVLKMWQQNEEQSEIKTDIVNKPSPQANTAPKPPNNFKNAQSLFNKEKDLSEQAESGGANKAAFTAVNSAPPPRPPANKKPSLKKPSKGPAQANGINSDPPSGLKRNPLPNSLALGPPPAKPNRPPKVDLEGFKRAAETPEDGPGFKKPIIPTALAPNLSSQTTHVPQVQTTPFPPSLPARHLPMNQPDDLPPPPPPVCSHPSQRAKEEIDDEDGEMYEDLDERWKEADKNQDKKKDDKDEKKRLEATKKEQKEREKKEQEARKKFKLVGSLEVIQKGKALTDCKGGKMDLALKEGDLLDIIRVQGNPEGKWLARTADGSFGYVKTTLVEIDFNSLKNRPAQASYEPEIYDDIDVVSSDNGGVKGPAVVLPPPPEEDGEIYDDVVDPNLEVSSLENEPSPARNRSILRIFDRNRRSPSSKVLPAPDQFAAAGNLDRSAAPIDEEIYDDVDSQNAPPPPPISSLPGMKSKSKTEDMDPKKQKKFEKEEKEFRKKFKYDGEIQVLYQVTITSSLNNKKWGGKDLLVKAGEKLDVIVKAQDGKLLCRNEEGKFGYVSTGHVVDDGEIYDDIGGDECIYDND